MDCEDGSTSSETSTTSSTAATANMCRTAVCNGEKVLRCTGCGYTSDRRANVNRHYKRIHGVLNKYRECTCGDIFQTKWEFYNHCEEYHPTLRQSWYTTTHVYKLRQTKAKLKQRSVDKSDSKVKSSRQPAREGLATRASTRKLRARNKPSTSSTDSVPSFSSVSSDACHESEDTNDENQDTPASSTTASAVSSSGSSNIIFPKKKRSRFNYESEDTNEEKQEVPSPTSIKCSVIKRSVGGVIFSEMKVSSCSYDTENTVASFTHLPIKKRYMQSTRTVFGDITNSKVQIQKVNDYSDDNNNTQAPIRDLYLSKIDEKQRAFIGNIDFDELDAILKLQDMKNPM